jgi:RHS repeat-associated protein
MTGVFVSGTIDHRDNSYYNENGQVVEVRKEVAGSINPNPTQQYAWHPFYIDAPVLRDYDATNSGSPVRYYYTFDGVFNVTAQTTTSGSVSERYAYAPYGRLTFLNSTFSALAVQQSQIGNGTTYTGRDYDSATGLYFYRSRYFHPALGCFLSRDPAGYGTTEGLSLYEYVASCPVNGVDPSGLKCVVCGRARIIQQGNLNALDADYKDAPFTRIANLVRKKVLNPAGADRSLKYPVFTEAGLHFVENANAQTSMYTWLQFVVVDVCNDDTCQWWVDEGGSVEYWFNFVTGITKAHIDEHQWKTDPAQTRAERVRPNGKCKMSLIAVDSPFVTVSNRNWGHSLDMKQVWRLVDTSDNDRPVLDVGNDFRFGIGENFSPDPKVNPDKNVFGEDDP